MRAIVALVFGGWFRNALPWRVVDARDHRIQVEPKIAADREADDPMWVSRW